MGAVRNTLRNDQKQEVLRLVREAQSAGVSSNTGISTYVNARVNYTVTQANIATAIQKTRLQAA